MPNNYFRFRQFTIQQQHCAMKVCTDACLFGAWIAGKIAGKQLSANRILDIGAGTGLLSLLLAQQTNAPIDALEIDPAAAQQSQENFAASPWSGQLRLVQTDARNFIAAEKYDLIISNPPFFENDLKSGDPKRNLALHSVALGMEELISVTNKNLAPNGFFAVLLPYHRMQAFEEMAVKEGLYLNTKMLARQTPKHDFFRAMLLFGPTAATLKTEEINIKEGLEYSPQFVSLLKDYYLNV